MALNKRLFIGGAAAVDTCPTENADIFGGNTGVALYPLDYDASDLSGNYDGTASNVTFGEVGQINYAASFNGSSSKIELNGSLSLTTRSISMWVKVDNLAASSGNMVFDSNPSTGAENSFGQWACYLDVTHLWFIGAKWNGSNYGAMKVVHGMSNNQWHHIVLTVTGSTYKVYIDKVSKSHVTSSGYANTISAGSVTLSDITLGQSRAGATTQYNYGGKLDQVRIFNKALSQSEVTTLYDETACVKTCTTDDNAVGGTNLAYYKFQGNAEDEKNTYDLSVTNISYEFGRFGAAAKFNGASSFMYNSALATYFNSANTISVSAWFKTTHTGSDGEIIWSFSDNTNASTELACQVRNSKIQCFNRINGSHSAGPNFYTSSSITVADGNWHHIVYVGTSSGTKFYIDGVEDTNRVFYDSTDASDVVAFTGMNRFNLGANDDSSVNHEGFFSGHIDQVRIFSTGIDQAAVDSLYNEVDCTSTYTADPTGNGGLQQFLHLDYNTSDYSGNGNNATNGGATFTDGKFNSAASIVPNNYINTGRAYVFNHTYVMWFKADDSRDKQMYLGAGNSYYMWTGVQVSFSSGNFHIAGMTRRISSAYHYTSDIVTSDVNDDEWNMVAFYWASGSSFKYSLNGGTFQTGTASLSNGTVTQLSTAGKNIGAFYSNGTWYYGTTEIDQYREYNRALTNAEVSTLYNETV